MTDKQDVAAVAERLSEAQRRAVMSAERVLIDLSPKHMRIEWRLPRYRDGGKLVRSLTAIGLTGRANRRLNNFGLAVKEYLEGKR